MENTVIMTLCIHERDKKIDIVVPLDITANELVIGLNEGFNLGIDTEDFLQCYLKTENPIGLLKGNKTLQDFNVRNGTIINITK